jgi:hypothetical protein
MSRECGSCSLCCKLLYVPELNKPACVWCEHARPGKGCGVYETRWDVCRDFKCSWLREDNYPDSWRPDRSGFIIREMDGNTVRIDVEPAKADSWRRQPFYAQIKQWAAQALASRGSVVVTVDQHTTIVFPDADVAIGVCGIEDAFEGGYELRDGQRRPFVRITRADGSTAVVHG